MPDIQGQGAGERKYELVMVSSEASAELVHAPLGPDGCCSLEAFPDLGALGFKGSKSGNGKS